jgi:cupin 2 domain-containing protein
MRNLLNGLPFGGEDEAFEDLLVRPGLRLERIVSTGQATPRGEWLEQGWDEWVLLLSGSAVLTLEGETSQTLKPGDHLLIAAGRRHRVERTAADEPTVWLAAHLG